MHNDERIEKIKETLGNSSDIITRFLSEKLSYIYLESVSSDDKISEFLLKSITKLSNIDTLLSYLEGNIYNSHIQILDNIEDSYYYLASGYTCLLIEDEASYIAIETKANLDRGVSESNSEPLIRGPKDSFTESNATNIGLIRKRIKDPKLRFDAVKIGRRTQSKVLIIYIDDIAEKKKINHVKNLLKKIDIDGVLDSGYIRDFLENQKSTFPKMISTERPDFACQNILNGKIIIMVENSPYVLILPAVLSDFFKTSEDYYQSSFNSSFNRILKSISFLVSILTPAIYLALVSFNPEMIPDDLLISLVTQSSKVPFPAFLEILIFIIFFDILREADNRAPNISGASMSIVGALILGDAAVRAGLVSPIVIIVVAIATICELVFTDMDFINAIREWRLLFILAALFLGIIGIFITGLILIIKLSSLELLDTAYLAPISPFYKHNLILPSADKRLNRPPYITKNGKKAGTL